MNIGACRPLSRAHTPMILAIVCGSLFTACSSQSLAVDPPLTALSDDFERPDNLDDWLVLSDVDGRPPLHDTLDIARSVPGALTLDPNTWRDPLLPSGPEGSGWFEDYKGPFVFKLVRGNFVVTTRVTIGTRADLSVAPEGTFNAGGLLARDPASTVVDSSPGIGGERWVMYNIGNQNGSWASETKTTFPAIGHGQSSRSSLFLAPIAGLSGRLSMCRLGDRFHFFRQIDGASDGWLEETPDASTVLVNNAGLPPDDMSSGFIRSDLPETLQVGMIANRWTDGAGSPIRATFHEITFEAATSLADCTPP